MSTENKQPVSVGELLVNRLDKMSEGAGYMVLEVNPLLKADEMTARFILGDILVKVVPADLERSGVRRYLLGKMGLNFDLYRDLRFREEDMFVLNMEGIRAAVEFPLFSDLEYSTNGLPLVRRERYSRKRGVFATLEEAKWGAQENIKASLGELALKNEKIKLRRKRGDNVEAEVLERFEKEFVQRVDFSRLVTTRLADRFVAKKSS